MGREIVDKLFIYQARTGRSVVVPIRYDGDMWYVAASDVPVWASVPAAQVAVLQAVTGEDPFYRRRGVAYHVRLNRGVWGHLCRVA